MLDLFAYPSFCPSSPSCPWNLSCYLCPTLELGKQCTKVNLHSFVDPENICPQFSSCLLRSPSDPSRSCSSHYTHSSMPDDAFRREKQNFKGLHRGLG